MTFTPSKYQAAIFDWIKGGNGHAVVNAVAGSGKTTSLEQAAKLLPDSKSAVFVAFNNHIVAELKRRLIGTPMVATTVHSAGRSALARVKKLQGEPDTKKYRKIVRAILERRRLQADYDTVSAITKLVDQSRNSLVDPCNHDALWRLAMHFDLSDDLRDWMLPLVKDTLDEGDTQTRNAGLIDFTDMIYLPIRWDLTPTQSDIVFGDEIQDWSPMQLELVHRMIRGDGRFLGVGDPRQSIMAFAGADDQSFWKIKDRLNAVELPLSVCYRCPKGHIKLAQQLVPNIEAFEGKDEGIITYAKDSDLFKMVTVGDLIMCRKTAPLVKTCIALIGQGVAARVRGRNVGKSLTDLAKTVSKMQGFEVDQFIKFLDQYAEAQVNFLAQKEDSEEQIENLKDRVAALEASFRRYYTKDTSFEAVLAEIEALFSDDNPGVWLSTIHRAKGLEADRVMILEYDNLPLVWKNQQPYQYKQEENLKYVALTRAKRELVLFGHAPAATPPKPTMPDNERDYWPEYDKNGYPPFDNQVLEIIRPVINPRAPEHGCTPRQWTAEHRAYFERQHLKFERHCFLLNYGKLTDGQRRRLATVVAELGGVV